jgi:hypothetical protein
MSNSVAIVEVICPRIIEVHRLLDEAQTDDLRIEIQVAGSFAGNCRDVMDS